MEKSLIIYGRNPGIVSAITLGVMNLISPFLWEGIFIPLVPDIARELFGAPVPLIIGTISPPRIADVSPATAILHLNDDSIQAKLEFTLTPKELPNNNFKEATTAPATAAATAVSPPRARPTSMPRLSGGHAALAAQLESLKQPQSQSQQPESLPTDSNNQNKNTGIATTTAAKEDGTVRIPSLLRRRHSLSDLTNQNSKITVFVKEIDFLAWFTRLPDVSTDMPVDEEISKRITHLRRNLCKYLLPHLHLVYDVLLYDPKTIFEEMNAFQNNQNNNSPMSESSSPVKSPQPPANGKSGADHRLEGDDHENNNSKSPLPPKGATSTGHYSMRKTMEKTIFIKNTIDHIFVQQYLPEKILKQINLLLVRIKDYNYHFCGNLLSNCYDWNRFLKINEKTNVEEFYPNLFLEPIRMKLEFQESIVHTQMFVSFMDRLRKESQMLNQIR
jgi:hypothetical protein